MMSKSHPLCDNTCITQTVGYGSPLVPKQDIYYNG